ncbi:hypothetical protein BJ508DRAFT_182676 [Ascobolus immersus RN42]|uniref:Uncharacterized protein n=1 Tax=Ascobolus immersus RN42 TaxID=1160509 RepID=A0A3N4HX56_ASCIM|nr:hypothetical protein BJ508DRAFT_182676 [Ascobolus immersus RN42]
MQRQETMKSEKAAIEREQRKPSRSRSGKHDSAKPTRPKSEHHKSRRGETTAKKPVTVEQARHRHVSHYPVHETYQQAQPSTGRASKRDTPIYDPTSSSSSSDSAERREKTSTSARAGKRSNISPPYPLSDRERKATGRHPENASPLFHSSADRSCCHRTPCRHDKAPSSSKASKPKQPTVDPTTASSKPHRQRTSGGHDSGYDEGSPSSRREHKSRTGIPKPTKGRSERRHVAFADDEITKSAGNADSKRHGRVEFRSEQPSCSIRRSEKKEKEPRSEKHSSSSKRHHSEKRSSASRQDDSTKKETKPEKRQRSAKSIFPDEFTAINEILEEMPPAGRE